MSVSLRDILFGFAAPKEHTIKNRVLGFVELQRPAVIAMGIPFVLAGAVLADRHMSVSWQQIISQKLALYVLGVFAVWLLIGAMHAINSAIDAERDKTKFPMRSLATGLIKRWEAVVYGLAMAGVALAVTYLTFNWAAAAVGLLVLVLGTIYTAYTRNNIGFLTETVMPAFLPIGGWVAISTGTVLMLLPWLLFIFAVFHQSAHMIACEAHYPEAKAFFVRPRPDIEAIIYSLCIVVMFFIGLSIYYYANLHWVFLVILSLLTIYGLRSASYLKEPRTFERGAKAFVAIVNYGLIFWLSLSILAGI
jgi:4-hydroxybenzoate polyprenyltransferase